MQHGMLFHALQAPERAFYFQQTSRVLDGKVNLSAFEHAWTRAIERHAMLRTGFEWEGLNGKAVQVVARSVALPLEVHDWRGLTSADRAARQTSYLAQERAKGFELSKPPLMRLLLARLTDETCWFVWNWHHILFDGWSSTLLLNEIAALYAAFAQGQDVELPRPRPFRDYITWIQRQSAEDAHAFWSDALKGFTRPTPLPARASTPRMAFVDDGSRVERGLELSAAETLTLTAFARRRRVTLSTLAHAAWALLLSRYASDSDVLFGSTVSGRPADLPGVDTMLGLFINTLPTRVRVPNDQRVGDWLAQIQDQQSKAARYSYASLVDIQGWSAVPRGTSLFDSILVFESYPVDVFAKRYAHVMNDRQSNPPRVRSNEALDAETTHYPLVLIVNPGERFTLRLAYDPRQYGPATIDRLLQHLATLLRLMPARGDDSLRDIVLACKEETAFLMRGAVNAQRSYPRDALIHDLVAQRAAEQPDAIAIVESERQLTYRELDRRSNQMARLLKTHGVRPETRVGVCLSSGVEAVVTILGIAKAGGGYVPLDPASPPTRLAAMVADVRPDLMIVAGPVIDGLDITRPQLPIERALRDAAAHSPDRIDCPAAAANIAYVMYTSGSTGRPKGVVLTHECLTNLLHWHAESLPGRGAILQYASLSFDVSFHEIFAALSSGGAIVVPSREERLDVRALADLIHQHHVVKATLPLVLLEELAMALQHEATPLCTLETVIATGEPLRISPMLRALFARLPNCRLHNHYGPSETHLATAFPLPRDPATWPERPSIGNAIANARIYVLGRDMEPAPLNGVGEIYIGGATIARGYWDAPGATAARFMPDPFSALPGARMYRSGDMSTVDEDGRLHCLGRRDRQLKIRGVRVEPAEVEAALMQHHDVLQAAVAAVPRPDGEAELIAYVVGTPSSDARSLRAHLSQLLPSAMAPHAFIFLDHLPLSINGKLEYAQLPHPTRVAQDTQSSRPVVRMIADVWSEVLDQPGIGADEDFFELGGHSLRAMQVTSRLREIFGDDVQLRWIFDHPTPTRLGDAIGVACGGDHVADRIAELWMEIRDRADDNDSRTTSLSSAS